MKKKKKNERHPSVSKEANWAEPDVDILAARHSRIIKEVGGAS